MKWTLTGITMASGSGLDWTGGVGQAGETEGGGVVRSPNSLEERLERVGEAEEALNKAVLASIQYLAEVSKDRVPAAKTLEPIRSQFEQSVKKVERELSSQLSLLSQVAVGTAHEGSVYAPRLASAAAAAPLQAVQEQLKALGDSIPSLP